MTLSFTRLPTQNHKKLSVNRAIHMAGHATAIYFGNTQKGLPSVFFKITLTPDRQHAHEPDKELDTCVATLSGGRLIEKLPTSFEEATKYFTPTQQLAYERAFEADIINILAGSLAEAKYTALRDGEIINPKLVDINALQNYGGRADLVLVNQYLDCLTNDNHCKERKMTELFLSAYRFVSDRSNWQAITVLANDIFRSNNNILDYQELVSVFENGEASAIDYSSVASLSR